MTRHDHAASQTHDHPQRDDAAQDDYSVVLELDGEVLHAYWDQALTLVQELAGDEPRTRLLDLGAGSGTGTIGLARRFPQSEVIALDMVDSSLQRVRAKAAAAGVGDRVRTVTADLDAGWPDLGVGELDLTGLDLTGLDLTWASMSLHHMADPHQTLLAVRAATRPGGLIAVAELTRPLTFLGDTAPATRDGFEDRANQVMRGAHDEQMPSLGTAWAPRLAAAGWEVVADRVLDIDVPHPAQPAGSRYARAWYSRLSEGLGERLTDHDRTTLAELLGDGPHSLSTGADLHVRGARTVTIARR